MLNINEEKMSKSLGNFKLLRDVLATTNADVLRFLMLQTHYRSPLDFSSERLEEAAVALGRIANAARAIDWAGRHAQGAEPVLDAKEAEQLARTAKLGFIVAMDDDFNAPRALGVLFDFVSAVNELLDGKQLGDADISTAVKLRGALAELVGVLGIDLDRVVEASQAGGGAQGLSSELVDIARGFANYDGDDAEGAADALLSARAEARATKDWTRADAIRDAIAGVGYAIEDTPQGPRLTKGA